MQVLSKFRRKKRRLDFELGTFQFLLMKKRSFIGKMAKLAFRIFENVPQLLTDGAATLMDTDRSGGGLLLQ